MADVDARIEAQHGPNCTCERLEPISFQPVIAGPNCPGDPTRYAAIEPMEWSLSDGPMEYAHGEAAAEVHGP